MGMAGNDDKDAALSWLKEKLPMSTEEERIRCYVARDGDREGAYEQLKKYLKFLESTEALVQQTEAEIEEELKVDNTKYTSIEGNPFEDADYKSWIISSKVAMIIKQKDYEEKKKEGKGSSTEDNNENNKVAYDPNIILPRAFRLHKKPAGVKTQPDENDYFEDNEGYLIAS